MFACLVLYISVVFPPVTTKPPDEHYRVVECYRGYLPETILPDNYYSPCELESNRIIRKMQWDGYLPGSKEIISYSAICTNTI